MYICAYLNPVDSDLMGGGGGGGHQHESVTLVNTCTEMSIVPSAA